MTIVTSTVPSALAEPEIERTSTILQERLTSLLDLHLTLKHVHWNVVGVNFISIHRMLDPQVDEVRAMSDQLAERIASLGGEPQGTPGSIVAIRSWDDYSLGREPTVRHLAALDLVYGGVIGGHRRAIQELGETDLVSQDLVLGQTRRLELFRWFVNAHLQDAAGDVIFRSTRQPGDGGTGRDER